MYLRVYLLWGVEVWCIIGCFMVDFGGGLFICLLCIKEEVDVLFDLLLEIFWMDGVVVLFLEFCKLLFEFEVFWD